MPRHGCTEKKGIHGRCRWYPGMQPYLRPTIVGQSPPPWRPHTMCPTPQYTLVATRWQVGRDCLFSKACNGRTTTHGVMYHPRQSASNVVLDHRFVGRGHVQLVNNYIGAATASITGKRHHGARHPQRLWQGSPRKHAALAAPLWSTSPPRVHLQLDEQRGTSPRSLIDGVPKCATLPRRSSLTGMAQWD